MFISEQCVRDHGGISRVASARLRATEVRADPPRVTCRLGVGLSGCAVHAGTRDVAVHRVGAA